MPITTTPGGISVYPIVLQGINVTTSDYTEVQLTGEPFTRFPLNEVRIPEVASVRLVVRAATSGTALVRLAYAEGANIFDAEVPIDEFSMDTPPVSVNFRPYLSDVDDDSLFCLEAETDGVNTLTIYGAWLLIEW